MTCPLWVITCLRMQSTVLVANFFFDRSKPCHMDRLNLRVSSQARLLSDYQHLTPAILPSGTCYNFPYSFSRERLRRAPDRPAQPGPGQGRVGSPGGVREQSKVPRPWWLGRRGSLAACRAAVRPLPSFLLGANPLVSGHRVKRRRSRSRSDGALDPVTASWTVGA